MQLLNNLFLSILICIVVKYAGVHGAGKEVKDDIPKTIINRFGGMTKERKKSIFGQDVESLKMIYVSPEMRTRVNIYGNLDAVVICTAERREGGQLYQYFVCPETPALADKNEASKHFCCNEVGKHTCCDGIEFIAGIKVVRDTGFPPVSAVIGGCLLVIAVIIGAALLVCWCTSRRLEDEDTAVYTRATYVPEQPYLISAPPSGANSAVGGGSLISGGGGGGYPLANWIKNQAAQRSGVPSLQEDEDNEHEHVPQRISATPAISYSGDSDTGIRLRPQTSRPSSNFTTPSEAAETNLISAPRTEGVRPMSKSRHKVREPQQISSDGLISARPKSTGPGSENGKVEPPTARQDMGEYVPAQPQLISATPGAGNASGPGSAYSGVRPMSAGKKDKKKKDYRRSQEQLAPASSVETGPPPSERLISGAPSVAGSSFGGSLSAYAGGVRPMSISGKKTKHTTPPPSPRLRSRPSPPPQKKEPQLVYTPPTQLLSARPTPKASSNPPRPTGRSRSPGPQGRPGQKRGTTPVRLQDDTEV